MITPSFSLAKWLLPLTIIFLRVITPGIAQSPFTTQTTYSEIATWQPLMLQSLNDINIAAPPDKTESRKELPAIKSAMAKSDEKMIQQIKYWDAGSPAYRWNQMAVSLVTFRDVNIFMRFPTAWVNMAIYDATLAAWKTKNQYSRPRPFQADAGITPVVVPPTSSSYPCEHSVTAAAAANVLAYFFPEMADSIMKLGKEAAQSRIWAGVQYPSDVEAGWNLGEQVAAKIIEQAKKDGADLKYTDPLPTDPKLWHGPNPVGIKVRKYKPVFIQSGDQFRPPPPPDFEVEMKEMKAFQQDFRSMNLAFHWASLTGFDFWTEQASKKIFEEHLDRNTPLCARIYAMLHATMYDAGIAIMDAKYAYWGIRPDQYDTSFHALIFTPPFPGYPSGHATASSAAATILSYFFPSDKSFFRQNAQECADSRFYAGIHFRSDNQTGMELGEKLATYVITTWTKPSGMGKQ